VWTLGKMSAEKDAVPSDDAPVVEPSGASGSAAPEAPEPAPEVKAVRPKRTYNRKPKEPKPEPKDSKGEPVPEPAAPRADTGGTLDPQFFAGLNTTLKRMLELERRAKLGNLRIV